MPVNTANSSLDIRSSHPEEDGGRGGGGGAGYSHQYRIVYRQVFFLKS